MGHLVRPLTGPPAGPRWPALDGLRGLAILVVLLFHFSDPFRLRESTIIGTVLARGWMGVDLFFALSGFLITGILLDTSAAPNYFSSFYLRRFLRIFPLYYGFLSLWFLVLWPLCGHPSFFGPDRQGWYWAYLSNWGDPLGHGIGALGHFWSLAIEEQFYLLWPVLVLLLSRRRLLWLCAALVLSALGARVALVVHGGSAWVEYVHRLTPARVDVLALGAGLALLTRDPALLARLRLWLKSQRGPAGAVLGVSLALLLWRSRWLHFDDPWTLTLGYTAIGLGCAGLVHGAVAAANPASRWQRLLRSAPLRALGRYSYGIYVLHFPIHAAFMERFREDPASSALAALARRDLFDLAYLLLGIAVSCALAWAVWHVYERPFLRLKDAFRPRPQRRE